MYKTEEKPKKPVWPEPTGTLADRRWIEEAYTVKDKEEENGSEEN